MTKKERNELLEEIKEHIEYIKMRAKTDKRKEIQEELELEIQTLKRVENDYENLNAKEISDDMAERSFDLYLSKQAEPLDSKDYIILNDDRISRFHKS